MIILPKFRIQIVRAELHTVFLSQLFRRTDGESTGKRGHIDIEPVIRRPIHTERYVGIGRREESGLELSLPLPCLLIEFIGVIAVRKL